MPENSGSPIIGRLAKDGLGFLLSTSGFPVAGLIGFLSQTTTPQMPPPHRLTRTLASPAWVSQIPLTSPPDCAFAAVAPSSAIRIAIVRPDLRAIVPPEKRGLHSSKSNFCNAISAAAPGEKQ